MLILKVGGNEIDDPDFVKNLGQTIKTLAEPVALIHGGGKEIKQLQEQLGLKPQYIDGLRVTDEESLALVQMVLAGRVNKRLVAALSNAGLDVFGMSGIDRASIQAEKMSHPDGDLGYVGKVTQVRVDVFHSLIRDGVTPIISPICYGPGGYIFNVNADHVALALATALKARELVFVTNVVGVLQDDQLLPELTSNQVEALIETGVIVGGMIPKVRSALNAVAGGVSSVRITNLAGLETGSGTCISEGPDAAPAESGQNPKSAKVSKPQKQPVSPVRETTETVLNGN